MSKVTIFMPVSRHDNINLIFPKLELLDCKREDTNIFVLVDGDEKLFVEVRNHVELSKFNERLCIQFKSREKARHFDLQSRRLRISDIHNVAKQYIQECDYVFGIEDDTLFKADTLKKLLADYSMYPYAGFIEGVQIGRWGIPYVGAWKIDDIYQPTFVESIPKSEGLQEIDAGGFYCFMTTRSNYVEHEFKPFGRNNLGPDVDFGLMMRRLGYINYIDWSILTTHKTKDRDLTLNNTNLRIVELRKTDTTWRQSNHS